MEDNIVYEDELLPELEIEELLTLEQMLAYQPSFVAFSKQEIFSLMHQLLKTKRRADIFSELHTKVVSPSVKTYHQDVVFLTNITRKNYDDDEFITEYDEAKNAPNYIQQQTGVNKIMFPFNLDTNSDTPNSIIDVDANIESHNPKFSSRILKDDPYELGIDGARWIYPQRTCADYLFDKSVRLSQNVSPNVEFSSSNIEDIDEWIKHHVRPSLNKAIRDVQHSIDPHEIDRILTRYGFQLCDLNKSDMNNLKQHIINLSSNINDETLHDEKNSKYHQHIKHKYTRNFVAFEDAIRTEYMRASSLLTEDRRNRLQEKYALMLQVIPPLSTQIPLNSPHQIATSLHTTNLQEVVDTLIQWHQRWFLDNIMRFFEKYEQNPVTNMDTLNDFITDMKQLGESMMLTSVFDFINKYKDVAELKEGNDTSLYDGIPSIVPETIFEETANEEFAMSDVNIDDDDDANALNLLNSDATTYSDIPQHVRELYGKLDLAPGHVEIFDYAIPRLQRVHVASGLPIDYEKILYWTKNNIVRSSRVQQLVERIPSLPESVANRITVNNIALAHARIQDLHSPEWREALTECYRVIHEEWESACSTTLKYMLTKWWLDLCSDSLNNTLVFNVLRGMVSLIHTWSSYGPPMQPDARTGILFYVAECCETLLSMDARKLRSDMQSIATEKLSTTLQELSTRWDVLQQTERVLNKADRARLLLENTIKSLKAGKATDIMTGYMSGIMYLPQLLPAKRIAKKSASWIQGCCSSTLDETFHADNDWKYQLSALYKIKRHLSKERWSLQRRSYLNTFAKDIVQTTDHQNKNKDVAPIQLNIIPVNQSMNHNPNISEWATWIPRSHMDMLLHRPNEVEGWARTLLTRMYSNAKAQQLLQILSSIQNVNALLSLLNRVASKWKHNDREIYSKYAAMKKSIRTLVSGRVSSLHFLYVAVVVLGMPAEAEGESWTIPAGTTTNEIDNTWKTNFQTCIEWSKNGFMMNSSEVQAFITRVREQQKEISLARLDILSVEDRQILLDAKNTNLLRIVEFHEIDPDNADARLDAEGEEEFRMQSMDADDSSEVL